MKLKNLRKYLRTAKGAILENTSYLVIQSLQREGPFWTGTFASSWVAVEGKQSIIPGIDPPERQDNPNPRVQFIPDVERYRAGDLATHYTIGNETTYRDIAQDLVPGRLKGGGRGTARSQWWRLYLTGSDGLAHDMKLAAGYTLATDPRVTRNYG